jgi:SAM-dependent methyltransferase
MGGHFDGRTTRGAVTSAPAVDGAMTRPWADFSTVDESADPDAHARYLEGMALRMATLRAHSLAQLPLAPGTAFLDAGCGLGEVVIDVARRVAPGGRAVGVDLSQEMLRRARESAAATGSDAEFVHGSVTALPFDADAFDVAGSERVFQHLTDEERRTAAGELLRVVRPGGAIQISDPNHEQWALSAADRGAAQAVCGWIARRGRSAESGLLAGALLRDAGAVKVDIEVSPVVIRTLADWFQMLGMEGAIDELVEQSELTEARARDFFEDLVERDRDGVFLVVGLTYVTTARAPAAP